MQTAKIIRVKKIGKIPTIDIEVNNENHVFYADGVAVSNSHSVSYALNGYQTAYAKAHFPRAFFTSYLRHSEGKPKPFIEINELVNNARLMDIDVLPPSIARMQPKFFLHDNTPCFGITNVKNVGASVYAQMANFMKIKKIDPTKLTWEEFLMKVGRQIKTNSFEAMIEAGVFDYYGLDRQVMLHHFNLYKELKDDQKLFLSESNFKSFSEGLSNLIVWVNATKKQANVRTRYIEILNGLIQSLEHPPSKLQDTFSYKAIKEKELLGIELTCSEIDEYNTFEANCTCREYFKGFEANSISIAARIEDIREHKTKGGESKGKVMAFLKISDNTCVLDNITIFSNDWELLKKEISLGSILMLTGTKDKKMGSFLVKKVKRLQRYV